MESATKALLIVAGALIGLMIMSLGVTLFSSMSSFVETSQAEIKYNELNTFNTQFLNYDNTNLTIHDVVTAANLAHENNASYNYYILNSEEKINDKIRGNQDEFYVAVYLSGNAIENHSQNDLNNLISNNLFESKDDDGDGIIDSTNQIIYEAIDIKISEKTGRVYEVYFQKK